MAETIKEISTKIEGTPIPNVKKCAPEKAIDKPEFVIINFSSGVLTEVDGKTMKIAENIPYLNKIAGRNGIGFIDIFEDGIMDLKSREVYEAPAASVVECDRSLTSLFYPEMRLIKFSGFDQRWCTNAT